jgi:flagellum-specific ATP synthase
MVEVAEDTHKDSANKLREVLATYREAEDLINIGAYVKGSNPKIDYALSKIDKINSFTKQGVFDKAPFEETKNKLNSIFSETKNIKK